MNKIKIIKSGIILRNDVIPWIYFKVKITKINNRKSDSIFKDVMIKQSNLTRYFNTKSSTYILFRLLLDILEKSSYDYNYDKIVYTTSCYII